MRLSDSFKTAPTRLVTIELCYLTGRRESLKLGRCTRFGRNCGFRRGHARARVTEFSPAVTTLLHVRALFSKMESAADGSAW